MGQGRLVSQIFLFALFLQIPTIEAAQSLKCQEALQDFHRHISPFVLRGSRASHFTPLKILISDESSLILKQLQYQSAEQALQELGMKNFIEDPKFNPAIMSAKGGSSNLASTIGREHPLDEAFIAQLIGARTAILETIDWTNASAKERNSLLPAFGQFLRETVEVVTGEFLPFASQGRDHAETFVRTQYNAGVSEINEAKIRKALAEKASAEFADEINQMAVSNRHVPIGLARKFKTALEDVEFYQDLYDSLLMRQKILNDEGQARIAAILEAKAKAEAIAKAERKAQQDAKAKPKDEARAARTRAQEQSQSQ